MYPGAGGGLSLLPSSTLICKRRKRNSRAQWCRPAKCCRVASFLPSIITWVPVVVELRKETPHTFTPPFQSTRRGVEGRSSGWVLWLSPVLCTCTEGHRRGRWGWTAGCCKDETGSQAAICIDCDQQTCASTARTAARTKTTTTTATSHSIIALPWM